MAIDNGTMTSSKQSQVKVLNKANVLPTTPLNKPSIPLTTFDLPYITFYYNQKLLLYKCSEGDFEGIVTKLKDTLAVVLDTFYPLAGRLAKDEDGVLVVLCHGDSIIGAEVVDAIADTVLVQDLSEGATAASLLQDVVPYTAVMNLEGQHLPLLAIQRRSYPSELGDFSGLISSFSDNLILSMADDEKGGEGNPSRGADWEVVSLTASTYAAAPGPEGSQPPDESRDLDIDKNEHQSADPMFMSGHFVFPPSEHENLPIEHYGGEIQDEPSGEDTASVLEKGENYGKGADENVKSKTDESLHGIQMFDSGEQVSGHHMEFGDGKSLHGLGFVGKEDIMYSSSAFGALSTEAEISMSDPCDENAEIIESNDPSRTDVDSILDADALKLDKQNKNNGSGLPCEAWWKRHAASWYNHAKEGSTFWSVFVAAALMGLVILGKRWHRENLQIQQLKWQFNINAERMKWMTAPINRFKDILVGGHQRTLLVRAEALPNHQVL